MIWSNNEKKFVETLLQRNQRLDGRQPMQSRTIRAQFLDKPGHLLYFQGETCVLIKINAQITSPKSQRPNEGFIYFKVDCHCCNLNHDQSKKLSVEISKQLEDVIVGSHALDHESLCIVTGRYAWKLTVDCCVIVDEGNVLDAILNGTIVALMDMKKPFVNVQKTQIELDGKKLQPLSLAHTPLSLTFGLIDNNIFIDPSVLEERVALSRVTVSMNIYKQICSIHKPGGLGIKEYVVSGALKVAEQKIKALTQEVRKMVRERKLCSDIF